VEDLLNITQMNPFVIRILRKHGWYEERNYDISAWLQALSRDGYESFEYAEQILRSLGGIDINVGGNKNHMSAQFDFNAMCAIGLIGVQKKLEAIVKEPLFPLGEMVQAIAYVGRSKNIYFGDGIDYYWIGSSIEEYLNNLFDPNAKSKLLYSHPRSEESIKEAIEQLRLKFPHLDII